MISPDFSISCKVLDSRVFRRTTKTSLRLFSLCLQKSCKSRICCVYDKLRTFFTSMSSVSVNMSGIRVLPYNLNPCTWELRWDPGSTLACLTYLSRARTSSVLQVSRCPSCIRVQPLSHTASGQPASRAEPIGACASPSHALPANLHKTSPQRPDQLRRRLPTQPILPVVFPYRAGRTNHAPRVLVRSPRTHFLLDRSISPSPSPIRRGLLR
jgi:hypothetical protein